MRGEIGRFFEGYLHETLQLMKTVYDAGLGAGPDVLVWIDGREMVFGRWEEGGRGFLRMIPAEVSVRIAFPKGEQVFDPQGRTKGYPGSQTSMTLFLPSDVDVYVRRMIDAAYQLED